MKPFTSLLAIGCLLLLTLATGCEQKQAPITEGIVWSVRWTESPAETSGLYRWPTPIPGQGGSYGVDMYGVLYPTCLEVRFKGRKDVPTQIIPMSRIVQLQFGDGGISVTNR